MKVYGVTELADALRVKPETVLKWRQRGKLLSPTEELAAGPIWYGPQVEAWIARGGPERKVGGRRTEQAC